MTQKYFAASNLQAIISSLSARHENAALMAFARHSNAWLGAKPTAINDQQG